jgi:hypothetical protein
LPAQERALGVGHQDPAVSALVRCVMPSGEPWGFWE